MADMSLFKVDLTTPRPNPNNPLEVRKGDAPNTAFAKTNNAIQYLGERIDGATVFSNTAPSPTVAYMTWVDTSANPALLKRRRADNKAWVTIGPAFQAFGKDASGTPLLRQDMGNLVVPNNPTNALSKLSAEPRYVSTINLTGLSTDRYYPVWWLGNNGSKDLQRIVICRHYSTDKELDPFGTGDGNLAGLFLEIENIATLNSALKYFAVVRLSQVLRKTVRNIKHGMRCANVLPADGHLSDNYYTQNKINPYMCGLYLRGGLTYGVISNYHKSLSYSREDGEVEISASSVLGHKGRWMAKSYDIDDPFLGPEYDNFLAPYNAFPYDL